MTKRRFPAPWTVREIPGGYVVQDATGTALAYVYAPDERSRSALPASLTLDEARRIARGIARLPTLMGAETDRSSPSTVNRKP